MSRSVTGRTSYEAPAGEMITRHGFVPIGDDKALLRLLAETLLDLAEAAGADQVKIADMRRLLEAIP